MKERINELEEILKGKNDNINNLTNDLNLLRNENKNLQTKNSRLEISSNNKIEELNNQLNLSMSIKDKKISESDIQIKERDKIIKKYESKISQFPFELSFGEKIISIVIMSSDENIIFPILCKNTDIFNFVEKKFYEKYPEYKDLDNYFILNGKRIRKNKSLDENKIKNNDIIIIFN